MPKPYKVKDRYFLQAKREGYRARSAYKLVEIQKHFQIIKKNDHVLDLGAAPGSFLQKISEYIGDKGKVIGIDTQKIQSLRKQNIQTFKADIFDHEKIADFLNTQSFNCITADLAPNTTGIKDLDQGRSVDLNEEVLKIASQYLKPNGNLVTKIFEGADFPDFYKKFSARFDFCKIYKPSASRDRSRERFLVGIGFRSAA